MLRVVGAGCRVVDLDGVLGTAIRDPLGVSLFYRIIVLSGQEANVAVASGGFFNNIELYSGDAFERI